MRRLGLVLAAVLALGLLAACGDEADADADAPSSDPPPAETASDPQAGSDEETGDRNPPDDDVTGAPTADASDGSQGGSEGTVAVDGTAYDLHAVRLCEPVDDVPGVEELFSLIASGPQGSTLDLYINEISGSFGHGVMWSGPEGIFDTHVTGVGPTWIGDGDISYDGPVIDTDGGRATGNATLVDSFTMDPSDTIDIAFDVEIPTSMTTC